MRGELSPPRCVISVWLAPLLLCLHLASTSRGRGGRAAEGEDEQESRGRGHGAGHCRTPGQGSSYRQQAYIVCKHGHGANVNAFVGRG